jgi:hypothetical protein
MTNSTQFKYRVVFFKQPTCVACETMKPIWVEVANKICEEYPHYNVGFGEWDVTSDDWEFCDKIECDGTPNFAVFDEEGVLLGINTEGMLAAGQLKDFIITSIEK